MIYANILTKMRRRYYTQDELNRQKFEREWMLSQGWKPFILRYPSVTSCTITYDEDVILAQHYHEHKVWEVPILTASSRITIECLNPDCSSGYFDLSMVIMQMVKNKETLQSGKMVCDGYQDAERCGQYQCMCELEYTIELQYNEEI